ncbi:hypothetical protein [Granulicella arctica]|uniref:Uncharacterized protein n=1 Tax=Granulicella arctica TaxID=940613 RepID=A0A7Y9PHL0_9BACT|nr:hypothetical protein [Granulicella arctica]NYF80045.1 hypothetical protein [Granulicella arctica]
MEAELGKITAARMASVPVGRRRKEVTSEYSAAAFGSGFVTIAFLLIITLIAPILILVSLGAIHLSLAAMIATFLNRLPRIELLHRLRSEDIAIPAAIHDLHLVHGNFSTIHLPGPGRSFVCETPSAFLTPNNLSKALRCAPGSNPLLIQQPFVQETI